MERKFLLPGEYYLTKRPMNLGTLLGSCVAICVYNIKNGTAAMNHFLLATGEKMKMSTEPGKYGETSCSRIIQGLFNVDPDPRNYQARIFGGADVNNHLALKDSIGARNIEIAETILNEYKLRVLHRDVGGDKGRKVNFDTSNNTIDCKIVGTTDEAKRLKAIREDLYLRKLKILVVDDSPLIRKLLSAAVNSTNDMEVVAHAEDPYEAREKLLLHDPDVILLDIIMPRMNGIEFLKKISKYFPKPVVIVSTIAKEGSVVAKNAEKYGATEVIDKEKLELYKGMDVVKKEMIPKIRRAFKKFKKI